MTINQVNNLESALSVRQKINLTIDKANSIPDNMTATWNNSGEVFTGIKLSITDTASDSESLLMNLFVDGTSKLSVDKTGNVIATGNVLVGDNESKLIKSDTTQAGANTAEVTNIVTISQTDYDSLAIVDSDTVYIIV